MKTSRSLLALALAFTAPLATTQAGSPGFVSLTFKEILALPKGRAAIYTPVSIKTGQSVSVHTLITTDAAARPNGGERGVDVFFFAVKADDSSVDLIEQDIIQTSASATGASGGGGAGKVSTHDINFTAVTPDSDYLSNGTKRVIIAVVGYDQRSSLIPATPFQLPKELALTAQMNDGSTALLLPAVQKVREAAAR